MAFKKNLTVLLVEDSLSDQKMLLGMLSTSLYGEFEVIIAASIAEAFRFLSEKKIDVILLDLNLEDNRGIETLEKVHTKFPEIAIVVNTGAFQDELGLKAVTMGAQDYLIKGMYKAYGLVKSLYYAVERKKAERDLEKALMDLQETQGQLIRIEKMNIVGSVASGIAHEVKNPLATILYGVEYLYMVLNQPDEKIRKTLDSMREAVRKANHIIMDLLDFSKISNLKIEECRADHLIDQALNLTYHQCEKCNIQVIKAFSEDIPPLRVDANRVEQVMVDVILNAIFAMRKEGTLTIRTAVSHFDSSDVEHAFGFEHLIVPESKVVVIDFEDTGSGIKEGDMEKIFDPFFTTRRAMGGVGLGLSVARTIMVNHKGLIYLKNLPGGGTRARLVFPT